MRFATVALFAAASTVAGEAVEIKGAAAFEKKVYGKKSRSAFIKPLMDRR